MQLAILLWLIYQQTGSLPDQRTRLYEQYISTFLNRESNKSEILRKHREPILQLHGYLAWILHARAEQGRSQGNIAEEDLKNLLRAYLEAEGYSQVAIVDELFQGMVERVVALVSRVQGTYEFEVQPLREYFAAYYLYKTARYSPPGQPVTGTKADRFDAIARNPYWQNVTRFYVGFFDKGELSYLLTQFSDMLERGSYSQLEYPRVLANTVIADQVFGQSPGVGTALAARLVKDPVGWYALAEGSGSSGVLALPVDSGGREVITQGMTILEKPGLPFASRVVRVLSSLGEKKELADWWKSKVPARDSEWWSRWISIGIGLDVLKELKAEEAIDIFNLNNCDVLDYGYLIRGDLSHLGYGNPAIGSALVSYIKAGLPGPGRFPPEDIFDMALLLGMDPLGVLSIYHRLDIESILKKASAFAHLVPLTRLVMEIVEESRIRRRFTRTYVGEQIQKYLGPCWFADRMMLSPGYVPAEDSRADGPIAEDIYQGSCSFPTKIRSGVANSDNAEWWHQRAAAVSEVREGQLIVSFGAALCIRADHRGYPP